LHVPANPPVVQFWSVTLYDNVTRGTDRHRSGRGRPIFAPGPRGESRRSRSTSTSVRQSRPKLGNWIETIPGKGWFPYFRLYGPKEAYFDKSWQLEDIELVK
jgi:hypothetical protein